MHTKGEGSRSPLGWALAGCLLGMLLVSQEADAYGAVSADARVRALYESEWKWREKELGEPDDDMTARASYLPHVDPASQQRVADYWRRALDSLNAISPDDIHTEKIDAGVFRSVLQAFLAQQQYRDYEAPITSGGSFWGSLAPRGSLDNVSQYRAYLGRMRDIPRYFDEQVANLRAGLARGFTPARVSLEGRDASIVPLPSAARN